MIRPKFLAGLVLFAALGSLLWWVLSPGFGCATPPAPTGEFVDAPFVTDSMTLRVHEGPLLEFARVEAGWELRQDGQPTSVPADAFRIEALVERVQALHVSTMKLVDESGCGGRTWDEGRFVYLVGDRERLMIGTIDGVTHVAKNAGHDLYRVPSFVAPSTTPTDWVDPDH